MPLTGHKRKTLAEKKGKEGVDARDKREHHEPGKRDFAASPGMTV